MRIDTKEILTLTREEMKAVTDTRLLMLDILEQVNDPDIYNTVKQVSDGLEDFTSLAEVE